MDVCGVPVFHESASADSSNISLSTSLLGRSIRN